MGKVKGEGEQFRKETMYTKAQRDFREVPTADKARIVQVHGGERWQEMKLA